MSAMDLDAKPEEKPATPVVETTPTAATSSTSSSTSAPLDAPAEPPATSIMEAFKAHKAKRHRNVMPTEDLEIRRFLLLRAAIADNSTDLIAMLEKATKGNQLNIAMVAPKGTMVHEVMGILSQEKKSTKLLKSFDNTSAKLREALSEQGRVTDLRPGEVVRTANGSAIPHDKLADIVARLKAEKPNLNVIIRSDPTKTVDGFMDGLRKDAMQARAFIEGGMQKEEYNDGVNATGKSSDALVKSFVTDLAVSSAVLNTYERNRDLITRADGDHTKTVTVDIDKYYDELRAKGVAFEDIRSLTGMNREALRMAMGLIQEKSTEVLVMRELLNCAIFVPRLCLLFVQQPMPRVVEYSRVMHVYQAVLRILSRVNKLPTAKQEKKELTKLQKEIRKLSEKFDITPIADWEFDEAWRATQPTAEMVRRAFSQLTRLARDKLLDSAAKLGHLYDFEKRHHAGTLTSVERELHQFEPQFTEQQLKECPPLIELKFYQEMWHNNQIFALDLLRAYEAGILLQLKKYIPTDDHDHWMSRGIYPLDVQCSDHTTNLVVASNEKLCEWRQLLIVHASQFARGVVAPLPLPSLEAGFLDIRVNPNQRWSPTFGQMMKLQRAMNALFRLSQEEFQAVFSDRSESVARARNSMLDQQAATLAGLQETDLGTRPIH